MGTVRTSFRRHTFAACLCAAFVLPSLAFAQQGRPQAQPEELNLFQRIERWFEQQAANVGNTFQGAGRQVENFGVEAGLAAKSTVEGARGAADAVARIPKARVVRGHSKCRNAPNGAPDCVAAATVLCQAQGFDSGTSVDMTTAEVCPPKVYMAGRNSGPGCQTETFVSRALCQ
ncbi:MAG: hypothetical protein Q8M26_06320 [Pseudolabrys sp.]|nr:hypothetical protein [Pseudolabrys sp.]